MPRTAKMPQLQGAPMVIDADRAFYRVDTRLPAHELPPGTLADATNKMLVDGRAWPRSPVNRQAWGILIVGANLVAPGFKLLNPLPVAGLVVGSRYYLVLGNCDSLVCTPPGLGKIGVRVASGMFIAQAGAYVLNYSGTVGQPGNLISASVVLCDSGNPCGYYRFADPAGFDTGIVLTDDWRNQAGEDGGRGRAWRIVPGNAAAQIPMNGNDIYGTSRLIPCLTGMVMLRQDSERHYFGGAAVQVTGGGDSIIQLNANPIWNNNDAVYLWGDVNSGFEGGNGVLAQTLYYVNNIGNNQVELYKDQSLTVQMTWTGAAGRFYLERRAAFPGYFGNGAAPLIAQPNVNANTWEEVGFNGVLAEIFVAAYAAGTKVFTAPNHNFTPGQAVKYWSKTGAGFTAFFVYVLDANHVQLMVAQTDALNGVNAAAIPAAYNAADYIVNATASGQPMPPGREGAWIGQHLVIVNGFNNIVISDPNDPLHYTVMSNEFTASVGVGGQTNGLATVSSQDTLIILNSNAVLALYFFSEGSASWVLRSITQEYGCVAPLSITTRGPSIMFLSRRGYDRVLTTPFGDVQPVTNPVSYDMKKYITRIDWNQAAMATAALVDNRLLLALPQSGQVGPGWNNAVLSLNFENSEPEKDRFAWEGAWTGAALLPYAMAPLAVVGQVRFTFVDYNGMVNWLGDGWLDLGLNAINDSLTTRMYTGSEQATKDERKIWKRARVIWDTNNVSLTVTASSPGYNENQVLPPSPVTYDRTQYVAGEGPAYNPAAQQPPFGAPYREDYSLAGPGELIGGVLDVHQNTAETFYMRVDDWGVQLTIANARGSARVGQVKVEGVPGPRAGSRTV